MRPWDLEEQRKYPLLVWLVDWIVLDPNDELLSLGFLKQTAKGMLEIGAAAKPLADAISDADLCTLSISQHIWEGGFPGTAAFLYGGGRLFLLDLKPGKVSIQQLAELKAGHLWIEKLLAEGTAAHYTNFIIPPILN